MCRMGIVFTVLGLTCSNLAMQDNRVSFETRINQALQREPSWRAEKTQR